MSAVSKPCMIRISTHGQQASINLCSKRIHLRKSIMVCVCGLLLTWRMGFVRGRGMYIPSVGFNLDSKWIYFFRAAIFERFLDLLCGKYRYEFLAATMVGQVRLHEPWNEKSIIVELRTCMFHCVVFHVTVPSANQLLAIARQSAERIAQ